MVFIVSTLLKLFERSALGFIPLRCANIFELSIWSDSPKHNLQKRLKSLLKCLIKMYVLARKACDQGLTEFDDFLVNEVKKQ